MSFPWGPGSATGIGSLPGTDPVEAARLVFGELPELWLPPSSFAVTPVLGWWAEESPVGVVDPAEVHAVYRVPLEELLDPGHRVSVRHPSGWTGPAFLIGPAHDVLLWGFTAGIVARLFDHLGWSRPWDDRVLRDLPSYMLQGVPAPPASTETTPVAMRSRIVSMYRRRPSTSPCLRSS